MLSATASTTNGTAARRYRYAYDLAGNRISQQVDTAATIEQVNGLNQLTNRAGTGGIVRVAGYLNETGMVTIAGAPARMTTATNFEGEVYALATTNVVTVVATDLSGNAATNNRTFTTGAGGWGRHGRRGVDSCCGSERLSRARGLAPHDQDVAHGGLPEEIEVLRDVPGYLVVSPDHAVLGHCGDGFNDRCARGEWTEHETVLLDGSAVTLSLAGRGDAERPNSASTKQ